MTDVNTWNVFLLPFSPFPRWAIFFLTRSNFLKITVNTFNFHPSFSMEKSKNVSAKDYLLLRPISKILTCFSSHRIHCLQTICFSWSTDMNIKLFCFHEVYKHVYYVQNLLKVFWFCERLAVCIPFFKSECMQAIHRYVI